MDRHTAAGLDAYITGNWGEDQFADEKEAEMTQGEEPVEVEVPANGQVEAAADRLILELARFDAAVTAYRREVLRRARLIHAGDLEGSQRDPLDLATLHIRVELRADDVSHALAGLREAKRGGLAAG